MGEEAMEQVGEFVSRGYDTAAVYGCKSEMLISEVSGMRLNKHSRNWWVRKTLWDEMVVSCTFSTWEGMPCNECLWYIQLWQSPQRPHLVLSQPLNRSMTTCHSAMTHAGCLCTRPGRQRHKVLVRYAKADTPPHCIHVCAHLSSMLYIS